MRVLLVQSYLGPKEQIVYPIGLAQLKAALKGHEVGVVDLNILQGDPFAALSARIVEFGPEVVGISLRNIDSTNKREVVFYYRYLSDTLDVIKAATQARVVIGGSGFSMFAEDIMRDQPRIDLGVFLEGERTFAGLLENLGSPSSVKNVFYREGGEVRFSGAGEALDLGDVPLPDRSGLPIEPYRTVTDAVGVETKRGCFLTCVYCPYGFLNGKKIRPRPASMVVDEIEALVCDYGVERFMFLDSVFNIPRAHAEDVCRELIRRQVRVKWSAWYNERHLDSELIGLCAQAGCVSFILSPDGFVDSTLKALGKNLTNEDIVRAYEALRDNEGYEVSYNFFKNPPGQSLGAFIKLGMFCVRAKREMGPRVHFEFNSMRVEPHTRLEAIARQEGFLKEGESLLHPKYYSNPRTRYIEVGMNLLMRLRGK